MRAKLADLGMSQVGLAERVAHLLGREKITQQAIFQWFTDACALRPQQMWALERALEVIPGTFSRHCGYVPADNVEALSIVDAINREPRFTESDRLFLVHTVEYILATRQS